MRFEVLTTVKMSMVVFWFVTPCELVGQYQHFGVTCCPHLQPRRPPWTNDIDVFGFLSINMPFVQFI
jgi:hypothetical protein